MDVIHAVDATYIVMLSLFKWAALANQCSVVPVVVCMSGLPYQYVLGGYNPSVLLSLISYNSHHNSRAQSRETSRRRGV